MAAIIYPDCAAHTELFTAGSLPKDYADGGKSGKCWANWQLYKFWKILWKMVRKHPRNCGPRCFSGLWDAGVVKMGHDLDGYGGMQHIMAGTCRRNPPLRTHTVGSRNIPDT